MARVTKADTDLLKQAREDYRVAEEGWAENRKKWLADTKFCIPGNQWPEEVRKEREDKNLPCLEVDKINQYVRQVVNDGRQNRPSVKVRPVDSGADEVTADAFGGMIRGILDRSNGDEALDTALEHAVRGGFGFMRLVTEYAHARTFNQDIFLRRIRNPLTVMLGPHQLADGSDARCGFVVEEIPKAEYKDKYPKAKVTDFQLFPEGWKPAETVRVCEYFYKVDEPTTLHLLADNTIVDDDEYQRALAAFEEARKAGQPAEPPEDIKETREIPDCKVKWCRLSGAEILEKNDWLGKFIPLIPVYGNEIDVEGKVVFSGLVRGARDSQMLHNFSRTGFAEVVAYAPKVPWLASAEATDGHPEWATAHEARHSTLFWNAYNDDGNQLPKPERITPAVVPAGLMQDAQQSEHDIQASMGMYAASIGQPSNEKSGRAIMARQREGDTATFHYQDNQARAIRFLGRQLVDLIPKVYDTKRTIRLLGEDGKAAEAEHDPELQGANTKQGAKTIYNLGVGLYDVSISTGPQYTTKRQESADAMLEIVKMNPTVWQTHGDLIVGAQDWPNADEFAKRTRATMPPPLQEAIAESEDPADPKVQLGRAKAMLQQAGQQIQGMTQGLQERDQAIAELQQRVQEAEAKASSTEGKVANDAARVEVAAYEADTNRLKVEAQSMPMSPEQIAAIVQQTVAAIMAQPTPLPAQAGA